MPLRAAGSGLAGAALGAAGARTAYRILRRPAQHGTVDDVFRTAEHTRDVWYRTTPGGRDVTLLEGPALAFGVCAGAALAPRTPRRVRAAVVLAAAGSAVFGAYGDLSGGADGASGGGAATHLAALARGRITTGAVQTAGTGAVGLAAGALLGRGGAPGALADGALVAGAANLAHLFDARPGRAAGVALAAGAPLLCGPAAGVAGAALGAAAALLPEDLAERATLGGLGARALGAAVGAAAAAALPPRHRTAALCAVAALTAAVEYARFDGESAPVGPLGRLFFAGRRVAHAPGPVPVRAPMPGEQHPRFPAPRARAVSPRSERGSARSARFGPRGDPRAP
ncbi:hypothetical protein [Streptomonospora wellingtoniae]|uniref:Uncharacterized protein n=1 Tax=Streptomonospora wellingtoniae TaxID=3075544 RepID=A0ABU2KVD3_9ACTN|nr:hypothetical protein [Streptomonospora sp. DSM 45055]MDT0303127.1 hypothetical protein [Streptomonospora sp. DSM 45055]